MFNKTIFKQTFKSNIRLWCIITFILVGISCLIIGIFNPHVMDMVAGMLERAIEDPRWRAQILSGFSLLNVLGTQFYAGMGTILVLIYLIITANSLIASQVDRGSMAYILSTPIKRTAVVFTRAVYFVLALAVMFALLTITGIFTAELVHGGILTRAFTPDVRAVAELTGKTRAEVADNPMIILQNQEALEHGAAARGISTQVYILYLEMVMGQDQTNNQPPPESTPEERAQNEQVQNMFSDGLTAAAEVLGMSVNALAFNMAQILNNEEALDAAIAASGMPEPQFIHIINMRLAGEEFMQDSQVTFHIFYYVMLNLGLFLLMFATSAISYLASCIFNLSKNAVAIGAGIPIAFYLFQTMAQVGDDLEFFKYLTINTFYNPIYIVNGGTYRWQFVALGVIGLVLYSISIVVFKEKDLPL